ncbi:isoleucine--tRNA ligase [Roseisolibacter agri]|uniref:Isoleucine--tRNA ligase n=1 Tax=Roseisolibacter agri TaxID=2014610 RepID=A0AA37VBH9_9BACT|nr:isoleucine--tRNA ligase [Roseisolibacter agri]GLC26458.1 isoleucine--tRNA ligase [Roseisolibacter agri]
MSDESTTTANGTFPSLPADAAPHAQEQELLAQWKAEGLFHRVQESRAGAKPFVFFEGPPTANGRPGIHHLFARTIKDLFCRHRAMQGYFVPRKAGWDTHGLPVEIEVEKQLGISGKQDIERVGVAEFNRLCRESVWKYRGEWEQLSERMAYWLDYDQPYVTYTHDYVESVWWALKTLFEKGLLFRGHKILPYCPRCGTALSSHEVALGYKDVEDPSVYVALDLVHDGPQRRRIIVWTTTPWTLVSNTALAVNPELTYVELRKKTGAEWTIVLAEARAAGVLGADYADRWDVVATMPGSALAGMRYRRPLDWVAYPEQGERELIVAESFVSADDGSGVVHMAPAFGSDDYAAGQRHNLAFVQPVNGRGEFDASIPVVGGTFVKKADPLIIEELRRRDALWKAQQELHSYPHCWRCGTPLLYYARDSWFVRTTAYRDRMIARNDAVDWNPPEVGSGRFGSWLENNIDWAVSRDRYWGTPLPVWVNDADPSEIEVVGSYAELAAKVGRALPEDFDPHKPHVDAYTWPAASGTGTMRRVPSVIDTWFDSGSMPFAQWHYPFENQDVVAAQYPADFIAEGVDQTRGWFYSLLAIATGLGDALPNNGTDAAAPYRAVVVNDLVLDATGQKMSKSKGNVVNPWEVMERHGADAARLFLVSSSQVWVPRRFDESAIRQTAGNFLVTLKNVYRFFALYANFGWSPSDADPAPAQRPLLDRWVLSRLATVEREADALLTQYDATLAARRVMEFFDDDVSKWYVRLSRARYWGDGTSADERAAFATLREVLLVTARLLAPFAPFITDWLHRALAGESVHLAGYVRPSSDAAVVHEPALEAAMAGIRRLANLGRAARESVGINVRQPLAEVVCVLPVPIGAEGAEAARLARELDGLLRTELNVKAVRWAESGDSLVTLEAKPNFRVLGKRFGKATPLAAEAVAALGADALHAFERGEPVAISVEGSDHLLQPEELSILRRATGEYAVEEEGGVVVALNPRISPELREEGMARELVSRVQRLRKESGLEVSDRVRLAIRGGSEVEAAVRTHREYIAGEVLARHLAVGTDVDSSSVSDAESAAAGMPASGAADATVPPQTWTQSFDLDGAEVHVTLSKDPS